MENIRGVATLYPETIHIITQEDSGIETVEDLEGETVNTGDLGSGTQVNALQILETAGISEDDFDEQNADFDTAADQIRDGDVDAAFVVGGWPVGSVEELATTEDIALVEVSEDLRGDVMDDAEWFAEDTIPGGTYDGVDDDVETVSVQAMIATHEASTRTSSRRSPLRSSITPTTSPRKRTSSTSTRHRTGCQSTSIRVHRPTSTSSAPNALTRPDSQWID